MGLIDGLWDLAKGAGCILLGIYDALFSLMRMLLFRAIKIIKGIYDAAKSMFSYAKGAYKRMQNERPGAKPTSVTTATGQIIQRAFANIKAEIDTNVIRLDELEKEEVLNNIEEVKKKLDNGEANGMHYMEIETEDGQKEIFDAEFFKADEFDEESKRRDKEGKVFVRNFC